MKIVLRIVTTMILVLVCSIKTFASEGYEELYVLKKTNIETATGIVKQMLKSNGYKVFGSEHMYVLPENADPMVPKYYILLFKQNKNDCYYYNFTNLNYMVDDIVLAEFEKRGIKYKKKENKDLEELFEESAIAFKSKAEKFNIGYENSNSDNEETVGENEADSNSAEGAETTEQQLKKTKPLNGRVLTVPVGSEINVKLQPDISTASLSTDDSLTATLLSDFIYDDVLVAPAGSILYGKAKNIKKAGFSYGNESVEIAFNELITPDGKSFRLNTETVLLVTNVDRAAKKAVDKAVGTTVGAIGGLVGVILRLDLKNSILWGLSDGGETGAMHAVLQRGDKTETQDDQDLNLRLVEPMMVSD